MPTSMSASESTPAPTVTGEWPLLPTETEIYILPDGHVVIADLPIELTALLAQLGQVEAEEPPTVGVAP